MEVRKTVINGREYSMLLPPVTPAMRISTRVSALIGPLIASLGANIRTGGWDKFALALQSIEPDKVDAILTEAAALGQLTYEKTLLTEGVNFEKHFGQHREDLYQVLIWCLWETVRDFFPQLVAFTQLMKTDEFKEKVLESLSLKAGQ